MYAPRVDDSPSVGKAWKDVTAALDVKDRPLAARLLQVYRKEKEQHGGGWPTEMLADAYGGDEAEEVNARTGVNAGLEDHLAVFALDWFAIDGDFGHSAGMIVALRGRGKWGFGVPGLGVPPLGGPLRPRKRGVPNGDYEQKTADSGSAAQGLAISLGFPPRGRRNVATGVA